MLFIDDEKIAANKLAAMFGVNLESLVKKPVFEIDKSNISIDKANGRVPKVNKGNEIRAKLRTLKPGTLERIEIRYAENQSPVKGSNGTAFDYRPHYIPLEGSTFAFHNNLDLALFLFLHTANTLSPCRESGRKYKSLYEFVDDKARSIRRLGSITKKTEALRHAESTDITTLSLLAKSLKINGVDDMSDEMLRVTMMEYADNPDTTDKYIRAKENKASLIEGRILNLIDKNVLARTGSGNMTQWKWASGPRKGEVVGDMVMYPNDPKTYIVNFLMSNLAIYERDVVETSDTLTAQERASEFLRSKEKSESVSEGGNVVVDASYIKEASSDVEVPDFNIFADVKDFIMKNGYKADMAKVKIMRELGESGDINGSNIHAYLRENFEKRE